MHRQYHNMINNNNNHTAYGICVSAYSTAYLGTRVQHTVLYSILKVLFAHPRLRDVGEDN